MRIHILSDNLSGSGKDAILKCEHGLSMLIETEDTTILCDMGASSLFLHNAGEMGLDLNKIDFAFISHGHSDHTGGLEDFLNGIPDKKVYVSSATFKEYYYSGRRGYWRAMSTDHSLPNKFPDRFILTGPNEDTNPSYSETGSTAIKKSCRHNGMWIKPDIAIVYNNCNRWSRPYGNCYLTKISCLKEEFQPTDYRAQLSPDIKPEPDNFAHEQALAIYTPNGLVIISSCSHCGAINIMESCKKFTGQEKVYAFIGGLHFIDSPQVAQEVETFAKELNEAFYPNNSKKEASTLPITPRIITGHCTSDQAKKLLKEKVTGIEFFYTGAIIQI